MSACTSTATAFKQKYIQAVVKVVHFTFRTIKQNQFIALLFTFNYFFNKEREKTEIALATNSLFQR